LGARGGIAAPRDFHRHLDVFLRRQRWHEMEELKYEPDLLAAQPRERIFIKARDLGAADRDRAGRGRIETGDQPKQR
jgi:hypothetical protein